MRIIFFFSLLLFFILLHDTNAGSSSSFNRDRLNRPSFMDEWDRNLPEPTPPSRQSFDEWKRNNLPDRPKSTPPKRPEGSDFLDDWRRSRAETSKSSNTPHSSSDNEEGNFDKYAWVGGSLAFLLLIVVCSLGCGCYFRKKWEKEEVQDVQQQHAIIRRQYAKNLEFNPPPVYPYTPTPLPNRELKPLPTYSMIEQSAHVNKTQEDSRSE